MNMNKRAVTPNGRQGFTLIEMLVVVGIIGVLASLVLVGLGPSRAAGRDAQRMSDLNQVRTLLEVDYLKKGAYPANRAAVAALSGFSKLKYEADIQYILSGQIYALGIVLEGENPEGYTGVGLKPGGLDCSSAVNFCLSLE